MNRELVEILNDFIMLNFERKSTICNCYILELKKTCSGVACHNCYVHGLRGYPSKITGLREILYE